MCLLSTRLDLSVICNISAPKMSDTVIERDVIPIERRLVMMYPDLIIGKHEGGSLCLGVSVVKLRNMYWRHLRHAESDE
jgi:hypothetical protein